MKTIVIIQARMGSSRLPGKILKPLGEVNVLTYVVERCKRIRGIDQVIIATSTLAQDNIVEEWCLKQNVLCYRGSETDVLDRYVKAAQPYQPDMVMRVTADCPFVDYNLGSKMIEKMTKDRKDFIRINGNLPRGLAVELCSYSSLLYIHQHGREERHREHVTYYAYENPSEFTWTEIEALKTIQEPSLRITLDTNEDYELCCKIADYFYNDTLISATDVVKYLEEHPDIAKINSHIKQKPVI
ncbi:cytidylyltransferase domain-containing protein [Niallia circulans]|jgi:spore coat polysaccharide biosynthesis protein SpsF|uniref:cytidylyltransferase domain-containing protein n=1 Tax=Niallia circulans TaxID=1397 RepID=UPI00352C9327